jgi:hypothetical protein
MRKVKSAAIACCILVGAALAVGQSRLDGKWRTEVGVDVVVFEFKVEAAKVTGLITRTAVPDQDPVSFEGTLKNDTLTFTVTSPDGRRTVSLTGKVKSDEIAFDRVVKGVGGGPGFYGIDGPAAIVAKRVKP